MIDYLSPSEVHSYSRDQILYILNNCLDGNWPTKESGYNDAPISKSSSQHMPGETSLIVVAEVKVRIGMCGDSGRAFYDAFLGGHLIDATDTCDLAIKKGRRFPCALAKVCPQHGQPKEWCLSKSVLGYITGECRRWMPCSNCPSQISTSNKKRTSKLCRGFGRRIFTFDEYVNNYRATWIKRNTQPVVV